MRIGLVDDDGMVRRLLVDTLGRELDIDIVWDVDSGEAALEAFKSGPVEILLLDLQMPGMDGIETITEFQRRDEPPLIVVVSALTTLDKVQAAFRAGAVGFFMKEDDAGLIAQSLRRADCPESAPGFTWRAGVFPEVFSSGCRTPYGTRG